MVRPFALLGFSAYAALVCCAAMGPGVARALAALCLGLACCCALGRGFLALAQRARGRNGEKELPGSAPGALCASRGLFWGALGLAVAGAMCAAFTFRWQPVAALERLEGETLQVRAQVLDYPEERYHRFYYRLRVEGLAPEGEGPQGVEPFTLRLSAAMPLACNPYDWVECAVTFTAFDGTGLYSTRSARLADGFQAGGYLAQFEGALVEEGQGLAPGELLCGLRRQVGRELARLLPRREAGFVRAMVLGDSGGIGEEDNARFRELGVSHILVVSGLHMTVLAAFLQAVLRRTGARKTVVSLLTGLVLLLFLALTGFQPSASRGAAMAGVMLLADCAGRRTDGLNSLGLAVLLVCLFHPFAGGDLGFALSVTATLGIVTLYQPMYRFFRGRRLRGLPARMWKPVAASLGATGAALVGTFPVQLGVFGGLPLLLPLANLLMVFPSTVLLYLGFCGCFLALLPGTACLAAPFVWAAGWVSRLLLSMAEFLSQRMGWFLPLASGAALAAVIGGLLLLMAAGLAGRGLLRRVALGGFAAVVLAGLLAGGAARRDVAVFSVPGAGDASCVVLTQNGRGAVLSFGGYRTSAVCEILQRQGVREVTTLCLPDRSPDARQGAAQVLERYGGKRLVVPQGAYVGRDLELVLGEAELAPLAGGDSFEVLPGVAARILPGWEGLSLTLGGVEVLVEWAPAGERSCGVLLTNQGSTGVNSSLSLWQTDAIIKDSGEGLSFSQRGGGRVLPVEEGCACVAISPEGEVSVRRGA